MRCPECNGIMVQRSRYVWSELRQKMIVVYYWVCAECGYITEE